MQNGVPKKRQPVQITVMCSNPAKTLISSFEREAGWIGRRSASLGYTQANLKIITRGCLDK